MLYACQCPRTAPLCRLDTWRLFRTILRFVSFQVTALLVALSSCWRGIWVEVCRWCSGAVLSPAVSR